MAKFGHKVEVKADLSSYMIGVMAPSGFGKTTLMYATCEREFGPDGYIILDMSMENGTAALQGATAETVPNWQKMKEVVDDIVKNKETDYKNLKVVILDTLDSAFESAEDYCVKMWNKINMGKPNFTMASSINSVEGGYGKGLDKVIETVKKEIIRLNRVGVGVWWTAHVKEKDQSDLFTGATYTTLTANMTTKYFNSIKNSSHIVAFGYFDRSIEKQEVGDANPITKKKKERKAVIGESRKLKFRDDALIADAKSRFSHIVEEIDLDTGEFIKAIKDAIEAEKANGPKTEMTTITKAETPKPVSEDEDIATTTDAADIDDLDPDTSNVDIDVDGKDTAPTIEDVRAEIQGKLRTASAEVKKKAKEILITEAKDAEHIKLADATVETLNKILAILD